MEYKDYEKMAIKDLRFNKKQVTDENIGIIISNILTAEAKYNTDIGSLPGYINMYIQFGIYSINRLHRQVKKLHFTDDYSAFEKPQSNNDIFFWEDIRKRLTNKEFSAIYSKYKEKKTLKEIGEDHGCSHENIRLIINKAIKKLGEFYESTK